MCRTFSLLVTVCDKIKSCVENFYTALLLSFRVRLLWLGLFLKTNPNFNTNAPPLRFRGCKSDLGGAFLSQGGAKLYAFSVN